MTEAEIERTIKDILASEFEVDVGKVTPETDLFVDLDLDSIDAVDLVVRLQQATDKKIEPDDFRQIRKFKDVVAAVAKLVNG